MADEYIKRSDAEKALLDQCYCTGYGGLLKADIRYVMQRIPSADVVEVRHGEWVGKPIAGFCTVRCSNCGEVFLDNEGKWNFCPNCGADMRGGTDG